MIEQATVQMASNNPAPYSVNRVDRRAVFTFDAGRPVFELVDPDGRRWVMQTYSQVADKTLTRGPARVGVAAAPAGRVGGMKPEFSQNLDCRHHVQRRARAAGRPDQHLPLDRQLRFCPRFDSVSIARLALLLCR